MKKTIDAELGGRRFHFQQEAFEALERYMYAIEKALGDAEEAEEVMADIEARIAELLVERLGEGREVVGDADVAFIIESMGEPGDFQDPEAAESTGAARQRRLYRDPEGAILGGVASGLAAYFNVDVVWIRLAFVLALLFGGFAVPLYLILWVITPTARSRAERLMMQGKPVTFENLKSAVGTEFNAAGAKVRNWGRQAGGGARTLTKGIGEVLATILRGIGWLLLLGVMSLFIVLATSVFGLLTGLGEMNLGGLVIVPGSGLSDALQSVLPEGFSTTWLWLGGTFALALPVVLAVLLILRLIFGFNWGQMRSSLLIGLALLVSAAGATLVGVVAARVGLEFSSEAKFTQSRPLSLSPDRAITLAMKGQRERPDGWFSETDGPGTVRIEEGRIWLDDLRIDIEPALDSIPVLEWETEASGVNRNQARERTQHVMYEPELSADGSTVWLDEFFSFPIEDRYRGQSIRITLRLPMNTAVDLHPSLAPYLRGVKNESQMSSSQLAGSRWVMTPAGLDW
jgi:phage shock protein PspC (stress-responsive transcriptional regulator)